MCPSHRWNNVRPGESLPDSGPRAARLARRHAASSEFMARTTYERECRAADDLAARSGDRRSFPRTVGVPLLRGAGAWSLRGRGATVSRHDDSPRRCDDVARSGRRLRYRVGLSESLRLTIVYEDAGDGWVLTRIPQVPGVITQRATRDEARENVIDAAVRCGSFASAHRQVWRTRRAATLLSSSPSRRKAPRTGNDVRVPGC